MPSEGPNPPTAVSTDAGTTGIVDWTDPSEALTDNGLYAYVLGTFADTYHLNLTGFGFSVPNGFLVVGIEVEVERTNSGMFGSDVVDAEVRILIDGVRSGTAKVAGGGSWPIGSTQVVVHGSPTDDWGLAGDNLLPAKVNAAGFGVSIQANSSGPGIPAIDYVTIKLYYAQLDADTGTMDNPATAWLIYMR